jgi:hypothetical protein
MKLLRKIGTGIISLGLISTFYTPDAKANLTILKWEMPSNELSGGRSYSTKIKNSLLAHKGSGKVRGWHNNWEKVSSYRTCHKHKFDRDGSNVIKKHPNPFKSCKKT